jgi:hypothetical protein
MNASHIRRRKNRQIVHDDVRLKRIRDRAKGIRFALGHEDLAYRQRKELEQTLRNLELAATGIEREIKKLKLG